MQPLREWNLRLVSLNLFFLLRSPSSTGCFCCTFIILSSSIISKLYCFVSSLIYVCFSSLVFFFSFLFSSNPLPLLKVTTVQSLGFFLVSLGKTSFDWFYIARASCPTYVSRFFREAFVLAGNTGMFAWNAASSTNFCSCIFSNLLFSPIKLIICSSKD